MPPRLPPPEYYDSDPAESSSPIPHHATEDEVEGSEENIFRDMTLDEILEELNARFLINLPREEMNLVRIYWQAEQAHWFYEDYLRPLNPLLPSYTQRNFTHMVIASSPLYAELAGDAGIDYDAVWSEYCSYKSMVPCCGGILINQAGDKCLMVRGWKSGAGWSFPRGKINSEESQVACAIREVEEETGFDISGMVDAVDNIQTQINAQVVTMFVVKGVPEDTVFEAQTRMEIGAIEWVPLVDLPTWTNKRGPKMTSEQGRKRFYNVTPFVAPLKRWLSERNIHPQSKKSKSKPPKAPPALRDVPPHQMISSPLLPPQPTLPRQTSTLDHLFSRFIHKQEEDLGVRKPLTTNGGDEKDGLARLFGNLGVVKADAKTAEEEEEDVLARLLDSTPAPQIAPVTKKQEKLLALLRQPPFSSESAFVRPHQANLLAVLGPNPRSRTPSPAETMPQLAARPVQDATPLNNPDRSDAGKNWKEQVVLGQNTAGFGTAMPPPFPHQPSAPPPGASFIPHEPTQSHWSIAPNAPGIVSHQIIPTQGVPYNPRPYQPHHSQQTFFPNHQPQTNHYRPPQPYHEPPTIATVRPRHLPFSAPPPPLNDLQRNVLSALRPPMPLPANHRPPPGRDYRPPDRPMPSPSGPFIPHLNGQAMLPKSFDQVSSHGQGQMGYPHFNQPFRPFQQAQSVAPWNPPPPTLSGGGGRVHQPQPRGASNGNGILANMHEPDVTHGFGR